MAPETNSTVCLIVTLFEGNGALDREDKACNFCHGNVIFYSSHVNYVFMLLINV